VGYIQSYVVKDCGDGWWEDEQDPGARGIDQFLADETALGQGLGTRMVRAFVAHLFDEPAVTRIQVRIRGMRGRSGVTKKRDSTRCGSSIPQMAAPCL